MGKKHRKTETATAAAPVPVLTSRVEAPAAILSFFERHARAIAILAVLLGSARIIATYNVFNHTSDEPAHIACGMEWLDKGTYTWEPQHPPLARVATAIGPYLYGIRSQGTDHGSASGMSNEGLRILYAGHHYDLTLALARLGVLPFFWIAAFVVYEWGRRYFSQAVAAVAVLMFTFIPTVLAHAGLATTDMALTAFLGAAFLTGLIWVQEPTVRRAVIFGACGGLAILSKFSSLAFFPAAAGVTLISYLILARYSLRSAWNEARRRLPTLSLALLIACVLVWAGYRFSVGKVSFANLTLPAPELYAGVQQVWTHNASGHMTYFMGEHSFRGWWYYFPVMLAVKTPLAFLALIALWIYLASTRKLEFERAWIPMGFASGILMIGMIGHIDIGLRHILPIYIGLCLAAAVALVWMVERSKRQTGWKFGAVALCVWFAGSSILSHPDYLPYFNELAGDHPEYYSSDSDLDWGQDIKRLSKRLKELGVKEIRLATLYPGDFEKEHGIPHRIDQIDVLNPPPGWTAVSIAYWKGYRLGIPKQYFDLTEWPDRYPPTERIGKGILLYYFPSNP